MLRTFNAHQLVPKSSIEGYNHSTADEQSPIHHGVAPVAYRLSVARHLLIHKPCSLMSGVSIWCCLWTWPSWVFCAPEWSPQESISAWARQNSNQDMLTAGVMTIMNALLRINDLSYVLLLPPYNWSILLQRYKAHNWEVLLPSGYSSSLLCWCLTAMTAILVFGGRIWFAAAYQQHTKHHRILSKKTTEFLSYLGWSPIQNAIPWVHHDFQNCRDEFLIILETSRWADSKFVTLIFLGKC